MDTFGRQLDRKRYGSQILSMTLPHLNELPELKERVEKEGFVLIPDYEPRPDIDMGDDEFKIVSSQAPISQEEFGQLPIAQIVRKLRDEWTPAELNARNTEDDFYNPMNAGGVGDRLQNDMPERLQQYVENAGLFFERGVLDQHYTCSFLTGIQKAIQDDRAAASEVDWNGVIGLCGAIRSSGEKEPFERGKRETGWHDSWLANWDAVHSAMADVLRELLTEQDGLTPVDFGSYRDRILEITGYLLACPDPSPADEQVETSSSGDRADSISDLHHLAINSARGRAFEAFVSFVVQDGKKYRKDAGIEISGDVKWLYERVLQKENRRTLMFLFGRYLPIFYFGDRDWIRKLLPRIFPQEPAKRHLYTAAWGGFLTRNLYEEMFFDPEIQALYMRGLELPDVADSAQRQRYSEPGARLAQHLALAFMHYKKFGRGHPLFETFWKRNNSRQHAHFVKFIGLSFISRDKAEESFEYNQEVKSRLREHWDWLLQKDKKKEVFREFGLWINLDKGIFEPAWLAQRVRQTLEKTNGILEWQHELINSAPQLAQAAPEETLKIARLYLLGGGVRGDEQGTLWHWDYDNKWIEALEILYRCQTTKLETTALINQLVGEGGRAFWPLKKILTENP